MLNRLAQLIDESTVKYDMPSSLQTAKHLLENNVIALPCPIGTTLYNVQMNTRHDGKTKAFHKISKTKFTYNNFKYVVEGYGTKYFSTREEAEEGARKLCTKD